MSNSNARPGSRRHPRRMTGTAPKLGLLALGGVPMQHNTPAAFPGWLWCAGIGLVVLLLLVWVAQLRRASRARQRIAASSEHARPWLPQ